jgi:glutamate synthase domain-containing protein 2
MKRTVRFHDGDLCHYHEGAIMDMIEKAGDLADIWYQHADLSHIKRKAMVVSREAHRYGFGSLLTNTYGVSSDETQEALDTWSRSANNRRGLERWINDEYSAKRTDIRRRTIQSVLRAQHKMRQENIDDVEYGMKVLSRLSEAFSQDSRNFARAMGRADEAAAAAASSAADESPSNAAPSTSTKKLHSAPLRTPSPRSVILQRPQRPRKNLGLGLSGESDFRNFV